MSKVVDLTGQVFGRLTVVKMLDERKNRAILYECRCECGNRCIVESVKLRSGNTRSCGCYQRDRTSETHLTIHPNQKYGRLTVIKRLDDIIQPNGHKLGKWECLCECGNVVNVCSRELKSGDTRSCGCLQKERMRSRAKDLTGQKFGRLTVLHRSDKTNSCNDIYWKCVCECGNTTDVSTHQLCNGETQSCGCYQRERAHQANFIDMTGRKFGKLVVLNKWEHKKGKTKWLCQCECGNIKWVNYIDLVYGSVLSCGCMTQSAGEYIIENYLKQSDILFEKQKKFSELTGVNGGLLSYDFYLPNHNILIEFQGKQHYEPIDRFGGEKHFTTQRIHDERKREYAKTNQINLLEISYLQIKQIESILEEYFVK